jgi:hypothetical protein
MAIFIITTPEGQFWTQSQSFVVAQAKFLKSNRCWLHPHTIRELAANLKSKAVVEIYETAGYARPGSGGKLCLPARGKQGLLELLRLRFPVLGAKTPASTLSKKLWDTFFKAQYDAMGRNGYVAWWTAEAYLKLIKAKPLTALETVGEV